MYDVTEMISKVSKLSKMQFELQYYMRILMI